jgi:hypothetical protein
VSRPSRERLRDEGNEAPHLPARGGHHAVQPPLRLLPHGGRPPPPGTSSELPTARLIASLHAAVLAGVKKFKFLGGEPLLRRDLPGSSRPSAPSRPTLTCRDHRGRRARGAARIRSTRPGSRGRTCRSTGGRLRPRREPRMAGGCELRRRQAFAIDEARRRGVPIKLNYVWTGEHDRDDLATFLWTGARASTGAGQRARRPRAGPLLGVIARGPRRFGDPTARSIVDDPHSLADRLLRVWDDGLRVELKHQQLGAVAPFASCTGCEQRAQCKEGIVALRLTHRGALQPVHGPRRPRVRPRGVHGRERPALGAVLARNVMGAW